MPAGLPAALLMLAQAANAPASYGPAEPAPPKKPVAAATQPCPVTRPGSDSREIVICAPRVEPYRIDPDLLEARREKKRNANPPKRPERFVNNSCAVGPMGCGPQAGINLMAAAITAATMAERAVKGENVGQMFVTDPQPSEYQLYLQAKARREAKEAQERAAAVAAKARAQAAKDASATNQSQGER
jgi:hypothetical protein